MGKAQSKRSIDITTEVKKDNVEEVTGKMEKIEDVDQLKPQVNGDTHHNDNELTEKVTEEGTENEKDLSTEKEQKPHIEAAAGGDDGGEMNTDENKTIENGDDETLNESKTTGETSSSVTEDGDSSKKTKKEKGKKKWSFRSISFGRKDKQKPTKKEEGAAVNGECEKVPEETTEDPAAAQKEQTKDEVKSVEATTETTTTTAAAAPTPVEDKPATITDTTASKPEEKSAAPPAPAQAEQTIPPAINPTEPAKEDISKTPETITTAESKKTEVVEPPTVSNGTEETTKKDEAAKPLEEEAPKECVTETPPAKIEVKDVKTDVNVAVDQSVQKSESQKGDGDSDIAQNLSPPPLPSTLPPSQVMVFALSDTEKPSDTVQQVVAPAPTEKISEPEPKVATEEKPAEQPKPDSVGEKPTEQPKPDSVGEKPTEQPKPDSVGEKPTEQPKADSVGEKPAEQPKPDSVGEKPAELPVPPASTGENIVAAPVAEPAAVQVPADSAKVISSEEKKTEIEKVVDVQKVAEVSAEPKSSESVGDNKPKETVQEQQQAVPTEEVKQKEVGDAVLLPTSEAPKEDVLPKSEDGTNVPVAEEKKVIDQLLLGKTVKLEGEINPDQIAQTIALIDEVTQEAAAITQQKLESEITQSPAPPTEEKPASQEVKEGAQPEIPKPVEIETTSCNAPNPPIVPTEPAVPITNTQLPPVVAPSPVEEKVEKVEEKKDETVAKTEVVGDCKQATEQQKEEDKKSSEAVAPQTESQQIEQKPETTAAVVVEQAKTGTEESKVTAEIKKDESTTKADTAAAEGAKVQPVSSTAASKENGVGENHEVIEHKTIEDVKSEQQTDKKLEKMPETTPGIVEVAE